MTIKSKIAFTQASAMSKRSLACIGIGGTTTDRDRRIKLWNNIQILLEIKKKTKNHSFENFMQRNQFKLLKEDADNIKAYFFYTLHDQPIDQNIIINEDISVIEYAYYKYQRLKYYEGLYLVHAQEDLSYKDDKNHYYYITVTYNNKNTLYCKTRKWNIRDIWVSKDKNNAQIFNVYEDAFNYVVQRFKKLTKNRENIYKIYNQNDELIAEYTYDFNLNEFDIDNIRIKREPLEKILCSTQLDI